MSLHITRKCDGHRHRELCRGAHASSVGYSPGDTDDVATVAASLARRAPDGWRKLPDGGDLCPSAGHDEQAS